LTGLPVVVSFNDSQRADTTAPFWRDLLYQAWRFTGLALAETFLYLAFDCEVIVSVIARSVCEPAHGFINFA
jgi:hypothetical protein